MNRSSWTPPHGSTVHPPVTGLVSRWSLKSRLRLGCEPEAVHALDHEPRELVLARGAAVGCRLGGGLRAGRLGRPRRPAGHDVVDLVGVEGLPLEQRLGHRLHLVAVLLQEPRRELVLLVDDAADLGVALLHRSLPDGVLRRNRGGAVHHGKPPRRMGGDQKRRPPLGRPPDMRRGAPARPWRRSPPADPWCPASRGSGPPGPARASCIPSARCR